MYDKIIVPVDLGAPERGEQILRLAGRLVDPDGEIVLLNVVEDLPSYLAIDVPADLIRNAVADSKAQLEAMCARSGLAARLETRTGQPAREILAAAEEHSASLVIIASHRPDFSNYFIGSTADRVVRHARCAVLVDR